jgi:hypothetical protein
MLQPLASLHQHLRAHPPALARPPPPSPTPPAQLRGLPEDHSCGQPAWTPNGAGLVFVAWPHAPPNFPSTLRRLGIVFCYNRPCYLMHLPYSPPPPAPDAACEPSSSAPKAGAGAAKEAAGPGKASAAAAAEAPAPVAAKLSGKLLSAFAPVFSPDGRLLVFLSQDAAARSGVHSGTAALHAIDWPKVRGRKAAPWSPLLLPRSPPPASLAQTLTEPAPFPRSSPLLRQASAPRTVVPVVSRPAGPDAFPGLYAGGFPEPAFLSDQVVLVNTQWGSQSVGLAVQLDTGDAAPVTPLGWEHGSWTVQVWAAGERIAATRAQPCPFDVARTLRCGSSHGACPHYNPRAPLPPATAATGRRQRAGRGHRQPPRPPAARAARARLPRRRRRRRGRVRRAVRPGRVGAAGGA